MACRYERLRVTGRDADLDAAGGQMITGFDTVFVARATVAGAVRKLLDDLHHQWPDMVVALTGTDDERFTPWQTARNNVPVGSGEVLVARDTHMEQRWEVAGYALMEHGEGPFAVLYQPSARPLIAIHLNEDPYDSTYGFKPYPATLVAAGLSLVTVVTPDVDSPFSRQILERIRQALADQV